VVEEHDHVDLGVVSFSGGQLRVLHERVKTGHTTGEVVQARAAHELFMHAGDGRRLGISETQLEVDDCGAFDAKVFSDEVGES